MNNLMIVTEENLTEFADKLGEQEVIFQVDLIADDLGHSRNFGRAYRFLANINQALRSANNLDPAIKERYVVFTVLTAWGAFPMLQKENQEQLVKKHLVRALKANIDVRDLLKNGLTFSTLDKKETFQTMTFYARAVETNEEQIGAEIVMNGEKKRAIVKLWVELFKQFSGKNNTRGALAVASFLTENENVAKLSDEEKELIKDVLGIFEWLRFEIAKLNFTPDLQGIESGAPSKARGFEPITVTPPAAARVTWQPHEASSQPKPKMKFIPKAPTPPPLKDQQAVAPARSAVSKESQPIPSQVSGDQIRKLVKPQAQTGTETGSQAQLGRHPSFLSKRDQVIGRKPETPSEPIELTRGLPVPPVPRHRETDFANLPAGQSDGAEPKSSSPIPPDQKGYGEDSTLKKSDMDGGEGDIGLAEARKINEGGDQKTASGNLSKTISQLGSSDEGGKELDSEAVRRQLRGHPFSVNEALIHADESDPTHQKLLSQKDKKQTPAEAQNKPPSPEKSGFLDQLKGGD